MVDWLVRHEKERNQTGLRWNANEDRISWYQAQPASLVGFMNMKIVIMDDWNGF